MKINFFKAKRSLTWLWFLYGGFLFTIFFIQNLTGRYDEIAKQAWEWFLPNILPVLSLIFTTQFVSSTINKNQKVEKFLYLICLILSFSYLSAILLIIFSYSSIKGNIIEFYKSYNIVLISLQSLVTASLGLFFVNRN